MKGAPWFLGGEAPLGIAISESVSQWVSRLQKVLKPCNIHCKNDKEKVNDTSRRIDEKRDEEVIDSLKKEVEAKDKEMKQKDDKISELLSEKENLLEQFNKIKRCAKNMDQEIKKLRSQSN